MNHLIIYAHPSPVSFSNQLKNALVQQGDEKGWKTQVRDLYALNFDPVLRSEDLAALKSGSIPKNIEEEQKYLVEADVISVIYPLWWASFPAILKGYFDKVFAYGFAYEMTKEGIKGKLQGKQVFMYTSMGNTLEEYEEKGLIETFKQTQGGEVFEFSGMEVANHLFFPQIPDADSGIIERHISKAIKQFNPVFSPLV